MFMLLYNFLGYAFSVKHYFEALIHDGEEAFAVPQIFFKSHENMVFLLVSLAVKQPSSALKFLST